MLAPTDFQRAARRAFPYGVKLAAAFGARLEILHVIKTVSEPGVPPADSRYLRDRRTSALLELGRLARTAREAGVHAEPRLDYGVPAACVLERAEAGPVQMIAMGTEGRSGWDRLRLGDTALAIARDAPCPVLAVHGNLKGDAPGHPTRANLRRILVATDFSSCSEETISFAAKLATRLGAGVRLVHVAEAQAVVKGRQDLLRKATDDFRRRGIAADGTCLSGEPVQMILEEAAAWKTDLIAVGTRGRERAARVLLGSVAEELLRRAGVPVLVYKNARSGATTERRDKGRRS